MPTEMTSEIARILRDCRLPVGAEFVRCGKQLGIEEALRLARIVREFTGDSIDQVFSSYNDTQGDYVRINHGSTAFALICRMKS